MAIKALLSMVLLVSAYPALAQDTPSDVQDHGHGAAVYHALRLDTALGDDQTQWDLDGWVGTDSDKVWLKSEGRLRQGHEKAEYWALYSRNMASFWDGQIGVRFDEGVENHHYLTVGVTGLAPYFFETQAHLFVREDGHILARLHQENDLLINNRLILRPYGTLELSGQEDRPEGLGAGVTSVQVGLQTRFEVNRHFAPYVDMSFEQKLGQTADFAEHLGQESRETQLFVGIGWLF